MGANTYLFLAFKSGIMPKWRGVHRVLMPPEGEVPALGVNLGVEDLVRVAGKEPRAACGKSLETWARALRGERVPGVLGKGSGAEVVVVAEARYRQGFVTGRAWDARVLEEMCVICSRSSLGKKLLAAAVSGT